MGPLLDLVRRVPPATRLRKEYGAEIAWIILGHANLSTTEIYAERDIQSAARAMARFG